MGVQSTKCLILVLFLVIFTLFGYSLGEIEVEFYEDLRTPISTKNINIEDLAENIKSDSDINIARIADQDLPTLPKGSLNGVKLEELIIKSCGLTNVEPGALDGVTMEHLMLDENKLATVKKGSFAKLNLEFLSLRKNEITAIEAQAFQDSKFERLSLVSNKLTSLTSDMFENVEINTLKLTKNQISSVEPGTFQKIRKLKNLDLSYNKIKQLGNIIQDLPLINEIYLDDNEIDTVTADSFKGSKITWLFFRNNKLKEVKKGVFQAIPVELLDLSGNEITKIEPGAFSGMKSLIYLYLSGNNLKTWNPKIWEGLSKKLQGLEIEENNIEVLPMSAFSGAQFHMVSINKNNLTTLNNGVFNGASIEILQINGNQIANIVPGALNINGLKKVDLSYNKLTHIKKGQFPIPLSQVTFDYNQITQIDQDALGNEKISQLKLYKNPISTNN